MLGKHRTPKTKTDGFYWQSNAPTIQGFVEVTPIKLTPINDFYYRRQSAHTRDLIGELFLQRNVPRLIRKADKNHLILDHIYDERDVATLQLWSRLCEYPPTHSVTVGYMTGSKKHDSVKLAVSLRCVGNRHPWAVQLCGMVISRLIDSSRDNYLLTPNKNNAEFWLQCLFAVVCSLREG